MTYEWHGSAFYQAQRPQWNALENRIFRTENLTRISMYGGTLGGPIIKNKLFNFVGYEGWAKTEPSTLENTVPTDLERKGDFSQTLNDAGLLRPMFDPWSTQAYYSRDYYSEADIMATIPLLSPAVEQFRIFYKCVVDPAFNCPLPPP